MHEILLLMCNSGAQCLQHLLETSPNVYHRSLTAGQISKAPFNQGAQARSNGLDHDIARRRLFAYFLAAQKVGHNMSRHAVELFSKP
jgi:hypothetical protein